MKRTYNAAYQNLPVLVKFTSRHCKSFFVHFAQIFINVAQNFAVAAVDTPVALSMSTIIQVRPNCPAIDNKVSLTIKNTGIEAEYTNAALVITKLC